MPRGALGTKAEGIWGSQRGLAGDLLMDETLQICLGGETGVRRVRRVSTAPGQARGSPAVWDQSLEQECSSETKALGPGCCAKSLS